MEELRNASNTKYIIAFLCTRLRESRRSCSPGWRRTRPLLRDAPGVSNRFPCFVGQVEGEQEELLAGVEAYQPLQRDVPGPEMII